MVNNGERSVEQIQLIVPIHASLDKGKISFKEFRQRVIETQDFHNDVSQTNNNISALERSKSFKAVRAGQSNLGRSKMATSKMGKSILDKFKNKSRMGDKTRMNMSKAMDRSGMLEKSRHLDLSKNSIMENNAMKKVIQKREDSKTLNLKKAEDKKEPSSDGSES